MSGAEQLHRRLEALGVRLWLDGPVLKCRAPRGVLTDALRGELAEHRDALRDLVRTRRDAGTSRGIERHAGDQAPLTFGQESMWFLQQFFPGSDRCHCPIARRIVGPLDRPALQRALDALANRHEGLRTVFVRTPGGVVQRIEPAQPVPVAFERSDAATPAGRASAARRRILDLLRDPFDLARGPLLRAHLFEIAAGDHVLALLCHHLVVDGVSVEILVQELAALHQALAAGHPSPLEDLPVRVRDVAHWQRAWRDGPDGERAAAFWRDTLAGAPELLHLAQARPRPAIQRYDEAVHRFEVPADVVEALRRLARASGATLYMTLLAAFVAVLRRYSGRDDVVVGSPISRRPLPEVEPLVGCFINTLPMRVRLPGDPSFRELLGATRDAVLSAIEHSDMPFEAIVEQLRPERTLSHHPVFQCALAYQQASRAAPPGPLRLEPFEIERPTAGVAFDLTWSVEDDGAALRTALEYDRDLFDEAAVERIAAHVRTLLAAVAEDPDRAISTLPLLDPAERAMVLERFNATSRPGAFEGTIQDAFADQARRTPGAVALVDARGAWTYHEVAQRANRLARRLVDAGVAPGDRVGVLVRRSNELVVALLGVLKTGAAYVPIDPGHPEARNAYMADAAEIRIIVADETSRIPAGRVRIDAGCVPHDDGGHDADVNVRSAAAYEIFTSGSTGRPKSVVVGHANVLAFFDAMDAVAGGRDDDTWLAVTSVSFDISVLELLWTLTRGRRVVIHPELPRAAAAGAARPAPAFSLMYFADSSHGGGELYRLLLDGARFADRHGFEAVYVPERHFHAFGGSYPNPAVAAAAVAAVTERIHIRAGSVVAPLHDPIRIAEEWAMVDRLSGGRAGISFASGWQPADFALAPERFAERRESLVRTLETVRALWRGEPIERRSGAGEPIEVRTLPRPVQPELPVWITAAGDPETFRLAGRLGANVLTHLVGQGVADLAEKIRIYREARAQAGCDPDTGRVTLMLHTYVHEDEAVVRARTERPLKEYLKTARDLIRPARGEARETEAVLEAAYERFATSSALIGTPAACLERIARLHAIGVDEIACLVDFGVGAEEVLAGLGAIDALRAAARQAAPAPLADASPARAILDHGVTHLQCTPAFARMLLADHRGREALGRLRTLLVGGDLLPPDLARTLAEAAGGNVFNMYGPTETTIWSTVERVIPSDDLRVSIGRPIDNTTVYVLDEHREPCPIGVPGELYIGGAGVAMGYRDPALTRERFLPNPFGQGRIYRTGDRARFLADGRLDFLGRLDQQVKVRGFRVELGEIEAVLRERDDVEEAIAVASGRDGAAERLVAYVTGSDPDPAALRRWLEERVPYYMVPQHIVVLDALPLTANGKVDRGALPSPSGAAVHETAWVAPRTPWEQQLAALWSELLEVPRVGATDHFFRLGGESYRALELIERIEEACGVRLPVQVVFELPTLERMAEHLAGRAPVPASGCD